MRGGFLDRSRIPITVTPPLGRKNREKIPRYAAPLLRGIYLKIKTNHLTDPAVALVF